MKGTTVLDKNLQATSRIVINEGGTRSSKTYSLAQLFVAKALQSRGKVYSIVRKTLPALKATILKDFLQVLDDLQIYDDRAYNKSDLVYKLHGNEVEFFSVDQPQKIRGRKRDDLLCNEANELTYEDFKQLAFRTNGQIYMDYNPSDEFHWIYDKVQTRNDCTVIRSTYLDNPFLNKTTINEIERLKDADPNYWKVYGLGLRGVSGSKIYTHWQLVDDLPEEAEFVYGLDFGFNNPSALVKIAIKDDDLYFKEIIYQTRLTNAELIAKMDELEVSKEIPIYADSAEPQRIEEMKQAGYNVFPATKAVKKGIDTLKSRGMFITKDSPNGLKEAKAYSFQVFSDGSIGEEPVKLNDHFWDAGRYGAYTHLNQEFIGFI